MWAVVHGERRELVHDLENLTASQWKTPSLCLGWSVHDVLAHLLDSAKTTRLGFVRRMAAARFDFDRDNAFGVAKEGAGGPADTLARFRDAAALTNTPPAAMATRLVEVIVHGEDIRRPLGISRDYPTAHAATALAYQLKTGVGMGGGRERASGWQLVPTDTGTAYGSGPEVRGTAVALLLAVSGRPVTADELTGPGAAAFLQRSQP